MNAFEITSVLCIILAAALTLCAFWVAAGVIIDRIKRK